MLSDLKRSTTRRIDVIVVTVKVQIPDVVVSIAKRSTTRRIDVFIIVVNIKMVYFTVALAKRSAARRIDFIAVVRVRIEVVYFDGTTAKSSTC